MRVRAGVQQDQRVHLEAQIDARVRARIGRVELQGAIVAGRDLAEPIDVRDQIAAAQSVFAALDQKRIMAVLGPVVAIRLVVLCAPARIDQRAVGIAANRIVPTDRVGDDRAEDAAHVRVQAMAPRQLESMLALERVRRVVALQGIVGIEKQHADVRAAAAIDEPHPHAGAQSQRPMLAAFDQGLVNHQQSP